MTWHSAWAFLLFLPLAFVVFALFFRGKGQRPYLLFSNTQLLRQAKVGFIAYLKWVPDILKLVAIALMIFAMARPQWVSSKEKKSAEGIDIMIALDTSDSMLIEDMKPENRLGAAKATIEKFISGRISDRIGLVVFSGESYTRVPLTLDYPLLFNNLAAVETTKNIKMGTAIGVALANAVARLKESSAKSRVVILLTDGENNSGTIAPETALDIAKGYGIKVYTIGVGKDGMARLPVYSKDVFGRKVKSYQPMHSKVNEGLLKTIANETGGKYYRATNSMSLSDVFAQIDELEKTKVETSIITKYHELFQNFLVWAFFLYALGFILGRTVLRRKP
tara:strand:+ start:8812 stop:9816 length:1005 start_codon:yes stop_codon:yes gene_type:complete